MLRLQIDAKAPLIISKIPIAQPTLARTFGRAKTPDPIALAIKAKILPLRLPFCIDLKVLPKKFYLLLAPKLGDMFGKADGLIR